MTNSLLSWQKRLLLVLAGVAVLALLGLVFTAGRISAGQDHPGGTSADAGFARDMQVHHAQAVQMSLLIRDRSTDEELRSVAYDIALTQQHQIGQMYAWLEEWGLPQSSPVPAMAWLDSAAGGHHGGQDDGGPAHRPGALMPGMATPEQLAQLETSTGVEAERLFLDLMIEHHTAGAEMAEAGADLAETEQVRALATKMASAQQAEISALQDLLDRR
ncbi:DUF305 domain-containing protein [Arthrobacter sp. TMN-37]